MEYMSMSMCQSVDYCKGYNEAVDEILPKYLTAKEEIAELKAKVADLMGAMNLNGKALDDLQAELPKIKADAIREMIDTIDYTCETATGDDAYSANSIHEYADKLEKGE